MDSNKLRKIFIDFFIKNGHKQLPPASLIPENDPSVLFTTAGMQQFKRYYTHPEEAPAKNVVTCQPCFRTSDIEEVGDETHLTFFEMLGNFSFGGYFKKEAIEWAYEFLTKELKIGEERIICSIFGGDDTNARDDETAKILEEMGLKYHEHDRNDNFWGPTGNEGPCGPTLEFYVNNIEVWNLVFNEYYKNPDGTYRSLETKGVDTGMGLERMLVVLNKKNDVFETDVFEPIVQKIAETTNKNYQENQKSFRIISDHLKSSIFLSAEGIFPSNTGQGYVLRRLIRRTIRYGWQLDLKSLFTLFPPIIKTYHSIYKKVGDSQIVINRITAEEDKFNEIIQDGLKKSATVFEKKKPISDTEYARIMQLSNRSDILGRIYHGESGDQIDPDFQKGKISTTNQEVKDAYISGREAFDLYQSYGFPLESILDLAQKQHLFVGITDFQNELKKHQELSRTASAGMFKGGLASGGEQEIKYHSATHLLLAALRQVLGDGVHQKGSNITAERLRFDFSYPEKLSEEQVKQVEDLVNQKIKEDLPVKMEEMSLEDAKNCGAIGEFGEKYGFKVKVYFMGDFSKEICGGPHVEHTGILGHFKIIKEESSSAGVRRIKAVLE